MSHDDPSHPEFSADPWPPTLAQVDEAIEEALSGRGRSLDEALTVLEDALWDEAQRSPLVDRICALMDDPRFLAHRSAGSLFSMLSLNWDDLDGSSHERLLQSTGESFDRYAHWFAAFSITELLEHEHVRPDRALAMLERVARTPVTNARKFLPHGLDHVVRNADRDTALRAVALLRTFLGDESERVREEAHDYYQRAMRHCEEREYVERPSSTVLLQMLDRALEDHDEIGMFDVVTRLHRALESRESANILDHIVALVDHPAVRQWPPAGVLLQIVEFDADSLTDDQRALACQRLESQWETLVPDTRARLPGVLAVLRRSPETVSILRKMMETGDELLRENVISALASLCQFPEALDVLHGCTSHPSLVVRALAVRYLRFPEMPESLGFEEEAEMASVRELIGTRFRDHDEEELTHREIFVWQQRWREAYLERPHHLGEQSEWRRLLSRPHLRGPVAEAALDRLSRKKVVAWTGTPAWVLGFLIPTEATRAESWRELQRPRETHEVPDEFTIPGLPHAITRPPCLADVYMVSADLEWTFVLPLGDQAILAQKSRQIG